ncbi:unnamed protein product [Ilex paraguariensis]|uniref:Protein ABIL2 n=1 Tax=Ilex paraguariensis TaxID=185542 RepID=A0ABC8RQW4_9AQUA
METVTSSASIHLPPEPASYDEDYMQQSLLFSDSLKDLKNLRKQLYSAAEYFELSYTNDNQKQIVVDTLKDYAVKAVVSTVDHLGSVTFKVNDLVDEKVHEVSGTELRVSCIDQRLRTCQEHIDREGLSQQSLLIDTPKYHKRYILPVGETMHCSIRTEPSYQGCRFSDEDESHQFKNAVRATIRETASPLGKGHSRSPSPCLPKQPGNLSSNGTTTTKVLDERTVTGDAYESDRRTVSPHRFPLVRSGSLLSRPTTPKSSRPTTPNPSRPNTLNPFLGRQQHPSSAQKSASMRFHAERGELKERDKYTSRSKRILKALLSRRKSKEDDVLYAYLDEY